MQHFTNETIDIKQLPKYEETALTAPASKYWQVMLINLIIFTLLSGGGLAILILIDEVIRANWAIFIGLFVLIIIVLFFLYWASFKRRGFALREKDIIYKSGVIAETTTIVPLNRIQHVALNEGMLSRIFKLGTLHVYTAGGSSGEIRIAGVPIEQAKALKEALVQRLEVKTTNESE